VGDTTKASAKRSKGTPTRSESAKQGRASTFGRASKRSARSTKVSIGRRTTLRVPDSLDKEVLLFSRDLGLSGNEALVRLAEIGARSTQRERKVRRVIDRRRAAVLGSPPHDAAAPFPSAQEMREAILIDRD
jgi:hypothetical protein